MRKGGLLRPPSVRYLDPTPLAGPLVPRRPVTVAPVIGIEGAGARRRGVDVAARRNRNGRRNRRHGSRRPGFGRRDRKLPHLTLLRCCPRYGAGTILPPAPCAGV